MSLKERMKRVINFFIMINKSSYNNTHPKKKKNSPFFISFVFGFPFIQLFDTMPCVIVYGSLNLVDCL